MLLFLFCSELIFLILNIKIAAILVNGIISLADDDEIYIITHHSEPSYFDLIY
jgi:hypothetical protein